MCGCLSVNHFRPTFGMWENRGKESGYTHLLGRHLHLDVVHLVDHGARVAVPVRDLVVQQVQRPPDAPVLLALEPPPRRRRRLLDVHAERVCRADGRADVQVCCIGVALDLKREGLERKPLAAEHPRAGSLVEKRVGHTSRLSALTLSTSASSTTCGTSAFAMTRYSVDVFCCCPCCPSAAPPALPMA